MEGNLKYKDIAIRCLESLTALMKSAVSASIVGFTDNEVTPRRLVHLNGEAHSIKKDQKKSNDTNSKASSFSEANFFIVRDIDGAEVHLYRRLDVGDSFPWAAKTAGYKRLYVHILLAENPSALALSHQTSLLNEICCIASETLLAALAAEGRKARRRELLKEAEASIRLLLSTSATEIYQQCLKYALEVLPGANVYIGLLHKDRDTVHFNYASPGSNMLGRTLSRGEGASFIALDTLETIVIQKRLLTLLEAGVEVYVRVGIVEWDAVITRVRGHLYFDVLYSDKTIETAVHGSRIQAKTKGDGMKVFGDFGYPFVCIPLRHKDKGLGVLNIDTFTEVPKSDHESHPESGLIAYLKNIGRIFGSALDSYSKERSLAHLKAVGCNVNVTYTHVLDAFVEGILANVLSMTGAVAVKVFNSSKGEQRVHEEIGRWGNPDTKSLDCALDGSSERRGRKSVQLDGITPTFQFVLNSTNKKVEHRTFVVAFSQMICKESSRCDVDALFMESIHREALAALIIIEPRRIKKAIRESNLSLIREINLHWELHTVQSLLTEVSRLIRTCFRNANLYFARMGPKEKSLRFIYGSTDLRSRLRTISFDSVEGISYFKAVSRLECFLLNHPSESFKIDAYSFPLLIIPLVVRFDTCIGVLCVDSFAEAYQEVEVSSEEVQYLETIAAYVSVALDHLYIADACRSIEEVAGQPLTLDEGTMRLNHILKNQMPDIESVDWHQVPPRPAYSDATAIFQANIVVFFSVVSLEMGILSGLSTVFVQVTCNAQKIFDSTEDDFTKGFSAKVALNAGLRFNATAFSLRLVSIEGGEPTDRVVLNIALHQLLEMPNLPLNYVLSDATLSSRPLARLCCRFHVLDTDERVGFRIDKAVLFETQLLGRVASRPFFTLHYRGKLISRVSLTASSVGSVAADCFIFIPTIEGEEEILINLSGLPYNIPVMPISKEMLGAGINAGAVVLEHQMNGSDKVSLKLTLSAVYANELSATDYSKAIYREPESPNMRSIVPEADSISFPTACSLEIQELRYLDDVLLPDEVPALSVRCLFMGQVVGQTSVICESMHPVWYKELFSLRWNAKDDIGNCILELVLLQEREGVDVAVGILTITGEELRQLLFCKFDQQIWCKLTAIPALNLLGNYRAELLLSIKAMTVENNIMEPSDLEPMLRLDVLSATGISLKKISGRSTVPPNSSVFIRFAFNGKLIYETSPVNADTPEFTWTEESMHFRPSLLRRLEQSELEIGVWLAQNRLRTQIASHVVRGLDLCLLFGQSNLRSMWIPLELHFIPNIFARVRRAFYSMIGASSEGHSSLMVGNLQLCGGMEDPSSSAELETIEEDGRTFFLDIIAASSVYDKLRKESLPGVDATVAGVYCAVYWNDRLIGKTAVIQGSRDPCWEGQRFILRPVIGSTSLLFSSLVIELWSVRADTEHELLGSLHFKGEALNSYLTETSATCQWWPVRDVVESSLTSNRLMNAHLLLRARLREPGATPMNLKEESIFQMHVLSAKKLPRAEVFAKVNPFARVSYNGQEIARSRTLEATQSPNFDLVFNLTFNVEQVTEIGVFTVEIFTVSVHGGEDILSAVDVEIEFFGHCLRSSSSVELPMATKTTKLIGVVRDPTNEIVDLKLTRIRVPPFHDPIYSTSDLWDLSTPSRNSLDLRISVVASKDLRKVFAVGHQRDATFVVHWGGRKLGSASLIVDTSLPGTVMNPP